MVSAVRLRRTIAVLLALAFFVTPLLAQEVTNQAAQEFMLGKADGERDAKGSALWILAGVGCGCLGVLAAVIAKPRPPADKLIGKTSDYVLGYTEGYQKKSVNKNLGYAAIGWGSFLLIYLASGAASAN